MHAGTRNQAAGWRIDAALAALIVAAHLAANPHYGFFRDELYFIVCGRHPAFGYVDQPPVVPLLAAASQLAGTSLFLIRALPALFAGSTAYAAARLARDMGGGTFAASLAAIAVTFCTVLLAFGTKLGPDSAQMLAWPLMVLCIGRAQRAPGWWLWAGVAIGFGAEAKYSAILIAICLAGGILLCQPRALLRREAWLGAALAILIVLPNAIWQGAHGWPMAELLQNGQHGKNVMLGPALFLAQQVILTNPLLAPLWLLGLAWCCLNQAWRWLAAGFGLLMVLMIALHGKAYYPAAIYPALFAAGAAALERATATRPVVRWPIMAITTCAGLVLAPLISPVLSEPAMLAYDAVLARAGAKVPETEHHRSAALGQDYADMHGWRELADTVGVALLALPPNERDRTWIFASNYGEASAVEVLATFSHHPVLSGHNQYFLWGPRGYDGQSLLDIGGDLDADRKLCGQASIVAVAGADYVMPYEDKLPIVWCRALRQGVKSLWPHVKNYN